MSELDRLVAEHGITLDMAEVEPTKQEASEWPNGTHYEATISHAGKSFSLRYHTGSLVRNSSVADVLSCVLIDAQAANFDSFEDWAAEFGYSLDSRKAERVYRECVEIGNKMRDVFTPALLERLTSAEH